MSSRTAKRQTYLLIGIKPAVGYGPGKAVGDLASAGKLNQMTSKRPFQYTPPYDSEYKLFYPPLPSHEG